MSYQYAQVFLSSFALNTSITLQNRLVMAPMTRCFAENNIPTEQMARYYAKRADAGLIISEATMIGPHASGYPNTPGIFSKEQIGGWKRICEGVHQHGGKFFLQLWHAGMMSHPFYREGKQPISAWSTQPKKNLIPRTEGRLQYGMAKAMDPSDRDLIISEFVTSAENALKAGCDGVELHAANGYLLDSFLHYFSNSRRDEYGETPKNMCRFVLEVIDAVCKKTGAERLGIRLSPLPISGMENMEEDIRDQEVFSLLLSELEKRRIAYVHVSSEDDLNDKGHLEKPVSSFIRENFKGKLIGCGSYDLNSGVQALHEKKFDLLSFGRLFIANPNLIEIIRTSPDPTLVLKKFQGKMLESL